MKFRMPAARHPHSGSNVFLVCILLFPIVIGGAEGQAAQDGTTNLPSKTASNPTTCTKTHTCSWGDTCLTLQTKYGLSEAEFTKLNPGMNCWALMSGTKVCVKGATGPAPTPSPGPAPSPGPGPSPSPNQCAQTHTCAWGDTCLTFQMKYGLSEAAFKKLNPGLNCWALAAGAQVCVKAGTAPSPGPSPGPSNPFPTTCSKSHIVVVGDTCKSIQDKYKINQATFMIFNPTINCSGLKVGDRVCVGMLPRSRAAAVRAARRAARGSHDAARGNEDGSPPHP